MTVQNKISDYKPSPAMQAVLDKLTKAKREGLGYRWEDFTFDECQELLKGIKGNLSDEIIADRGER